MKIQVKKVGKMYRALGQGLCSFPIRLSQGTHILEVYRSEKKPHFYAWQDKRGNLVVSQKKGKVNCNFCEGPCTVDSAFSISPGRRGHGLTRQRRTPVGFRLRRMR